MKIPKTIAAFGDSITQAVEVPEEKRWPALLAVTLDTKVVNCGVGGNTSREGLARIEGVLAHEPDLILIEFGGNDATDDQNRYVNPDEFKANLEQMRQKFADAGAQIALLTFPPVVEAWSRHKTIAWQQEHGGVDTHIERYRQATREFAREHGFLLIDIYAALRSAGEKEGWEKFYQQDGVHLTAAGNGVICETVVSALRDHLPGRHFNTK